VFGFEEALGYSVGELVRDKDGIGAAVVFAELAAVCNRRGRSILEELERIARTYGLWLSAQRSITVQGVDGKERMARMMADLRRAPPEAIAGLEVLAARDLSAGTRRAADGTTTPIDLPPSDVLVWELAGGSRVIVRPSGTEPKVKLYFDHREVVDAGEPVTRARERGERVLAAMDAAFAHLA
jgi:phosphomannomutase